MNTIQQATNKDNSTNNFEQLKSLMAEVGLPFPEDKDINLDGSIHRYSSRLNGDEDEWYIGSEVAPGIYVCTFASWRIGENHHWRSSEYKQNPEARKAYEVQQEKALLYEVSKREEGKAKAKKMWDNAITCHRHPYLERKKLPCLNLKQTSGMLLIPLYNTENKLSCVQTIGPNGDKRFPGIPMKGYFHVIGNLKGQKDAYVCEGYATGLSVNLSTKKPVVIAFSSSLVCVIGKTIQNIHPEIRLTLAADKGTAGEKAAKEWKDVISDSVVFPSQHSDFNDAWVFDGIGSTRNQLKIQDPLSFTGIDIQSFIKKKLPEIVFVNQFLQEGTFNILFGEAGVGKSRIAYELAVCLSIKKSFVNFFETYLQKRVLYLDCEMPASQVQVRFKETLLLHSEDEMPDDTLFVLDKESLKEELGAHVNVYDPEHANRIFPFFENFDVIFLDNFNNMHQTPNTESQLTMKSYWQKMFLNIHNLKAKGKIIIMIMHTNKGGSLEGVQQIKNDADSIIKFERLLFPPLDSLLQCKMVYEKPRDIPAYEQTPKIITLTKEGWDTKEISK